MFFRVKRKVKLMLTKKKRTILLVVIAAVALLVVLIPFLVMKISKAFTAQEQAVLSLIHI